MTNSSKIHDDRSPSFILNGLHRGLPAALQPVDHASLTFFRVAFGGLMAAWVWNYLTSGRVTKLYIEPEFHFTYPGFAWIEPWSGSGMYFHFLALLLLALMVAAGCLYRLASLLFAIGFMYVFLVERTNYQNHYYLICLFTCLLVALPLNRHISFDARMAARRGKHTTSESFPAWMLWSVRFHVALPYFFGGVAKLTPDWLLGQPMGVFLSTKADMPILGPLLASAPAGVVLSWGGLLFDLLIVPALLWKPTRGVAYLAAVAFHMSNSVLFSIHIFPWFMIVATTVFFEPDWPRRILSGTRRSFPAVVQWHWTPKRRLAVSLIGFYVAFQCVWPLRHNLFSGETSWHERGHLFAWRMMLRAKEVGVGYALVDPETEAAVNIDHKQFMGSEQSEKFARDPELIRQFGRYIADRFETEVGRRPKVYAFALASLNGRKPQFLVDPNFDLASQPIDGNDSSAWILPLEEPLREPPWDVPVAQWREHVEMPRIDFLEMMQASAERHYMNAAGGRHSGTPAR